MIFLRTRLAFRQSQSCGIYYGHLFHHCNNQPKINFPKRMLFEKSRDEQPLRTLKELKETFTMRALTFSNAVGDWSFDKILSMLPGKQEDMKPRRMRDSWCHVLIPLGSNDELRAEYLALSGGLRIGRLLEDLDSFAGWISYQHILNPENKEEMPPPMFMATVSVDHIDFQECINISANKDIKLEGHVSWVGRSSLEISIFVLQYIQGKWSKVTKAVFCNVVRNPLLNTATPVNPLVCDSQKEKELFNAGELRKMKRIKRQENALFISPPNESEKVLVHELLMKMADPTQHSYSLKNMPVNSKWMNDAKLKNVTLCFFENRNLLGKIFGGFLMKEAFELAYANAAVYSGGTPKILHIYDILFRLPVEVGSMLFLNSQVVYTDGCHMQISTKASVFDVEKGTTNMTNIFHFTFQVQKPVHVCLPHSYQDAMMYIDGRRRYQQVVDKKIF